MRLLMLAPCPFPAPQGTQVVIGDLASALGARHAVHLVTYGYGLGSADAAPPSFALHRARRFDVGRRSGPHPGKALADLALLRRALQVVRRERPQVLHAHHVEGLAVGLVLRRLCGLPLVYHAHTVLEAELPTYYRHRLGRAAARLAGAAFDRTLPRRADLVIAFDAAAASRHMHDGVSLARLACIPPGIRPLPRRRTAEGSGGAPHFVYAGNADTYQNLPLLRAAFARVRRRVPTARLTVVTHHDAAPFGAMGPGVHLVPHACRTTLVEALGRAHVGVCPRRLAAGAPIKVLNYLAAGLPVVACRGRGVDLVPQAMGIWAAPDPEPFAAAMLAAAARALAPGGWMTALPPELDVLHQVPAYEAVYARLLQTRRPRRAVTAGVVGGRRAAM